jgi:hypothetical protein
MSTNVKLAFRNFSGLVFVDLKKTVVFDKRGGIADNSRFNSAWTGNLTQEQNRK